MTAAGAFPTDKTNIQYKARTDARADVITDSEWFYLPHPGKGFDKYVCSKCLHSK
jgi:hypothetical protein